MSDADTEEAMRAEQLRQEVDAARDAITEGDWSTARMRLVDGLLILRLLSAEAERRP